MKKKRKKYWMPIGAAELRNMLMSVFGAKEKEKKTNHSTMLSI